MGYHRYKNPNSPPTSAFTRLPGETVSDAMRRVDLGWKAAFAARENEQERAAFAAKMEMETPSIMPDPELPLEAAQAHMRGLLQGPEAVLRYLTAGNATLTVVSKATGKRFTFRFRRPEAKPGQDPKNLPVFVSLMNGPDNESSYQFLGSLFADDPATGTTGGVHYAHGRKSAVGQDAPSVRAVRWLIAALHGGKLDQCEIWHEGTCGRCGRKLTVPSSVESGYGPECIKMVGM